MLIIGCDFHSRFQQIAMLDEQTGEIIERRLEHETGEARDILRSTSELRHSWVWKPPVTRIGFNECLQNKGTSCGLVMQRRYASRMVRKQKTDKRDAAHLLSLLLENRFPRIWIPSPAERDLRQLLRHRFKLICMRSSVKNQLHALAMGQGVCRMKKLWAPAGRKELEALALDPWANRRRQELLEILDQLNPAD